MLKSKDAKLRCLSEFRMIDRLHLLGAAVFFCEVSVLNKVLREEKKFDGVDALKEQLQKDMEAGKKFWH